MQVLGHIDIGPVVEVGAVDEVDDSSVRLQQVAGTDVAVRGGRRARLVQLSSKSTG